MDEPTVTITAASPPAAGTVTPQSVRADIAYRVLRETEDGHWVDASLTEARTPEQAIEKVIGDNDPGALGWVAIASRYWSPQSFEVKVETTRTLVAKGKA